MFAATALELLPKERNEAAVPVVVGFGPGIALMVGIRVVGQMIQREAPPKRG